MWHLATEANMITLKVYRNGKLVGEHSYNCEHTAERERKRLIEKGYTVV